MKISTNNQNGMVQRSVMFGLATIVTSFIFTSVAVVFTAGANGTAPVAGQVAAADGAVVQLVSRSGA